MKGQVLWIIGNELDGGNFERLCVDLLHRNGYRDIVPVEPQDGGRDAEEFPRQGRGRDGCAAFFQFSLEQDWKRKLRRDARKLGNRRGEFTTLVFVTSRTARGVDVDLIKSEIRQEFGWMLVVYSREWLRLQLEEAHPDLAKRHLGFDIPFSLSAPVWIIPDSEAADTALADILAKLEDGHFETAIGALNVFVRDHPESGVARQALAWAHYCVHRLDEALGEINRAIKLKSSTQALSIRACILTEKGIRDSNKAAVRDGLQLFEQILQSATIPAWQLLYNVGNALGALGQHEEAISRYKQALEIDARRSEVWKNLASAYHRVGNHQEEMRCFDRALELDPLKPEALVSKAISLMSDFGNAEEAVLLLETAMSTTPEFASRWPALWYWLALAHKRNGTLTKALAWAEDGLRHQPGDLALMRLKSHVLSTLVTQSPERAAEAQQYWESQLKDEPRDFNTIRQLIRLHLQQGDTSAAWDRLDRCYELVEVSPAISVKIAGFEILEALEAFEFLPQYSVYRRAYPISDYWDRGDPLYDLPFDPPRSEQIIAALTTFCAIPFGLGSRHLENQSAAREADESLPELFEVIRVNIEHAIVEAARTLAGAVPTTQRREDLARPITEILLFLSLVAIREFGRQRGWIASQFRIPNASLTRVMDNYDEVLIANNVMSRALITITEELKIVAC